MADEEVPGYPSPTRIKPPVYIPGSGRRTRYPLPDEIDEIKEARQALIEAGRVQKTCPECEARFVVEPEKCPTCKGLEWQAHPLRGVASRHVTHTEKYREAGKKAAAFYQLINPGCVHPVCIPRPENEPPDGLTPNLEAPCGHMASLKCKTCGPLCYGHAVDHGCPPEDLEPNDPTPYTPSPSMTEPPVTWTCDHCHQTVVYQLPIPEDKICWRCKPQGCGNCRFFLPDHERVGIGTCRHDPVRLTSWPMMPSDGHILPDFAIQPATDYIGWCGDWTEGPPPLPLPKPEKPAPRSKIIIPGGR